MSADPDENGFRADFDSGRQVLDEEGTVDQAIKQRVINARERVDEAEQALFIEAATDPELQLSHGEQVVVWGTAVKQFLRAIEPLLESDEVAGSDAYYIEKEIGRMTLLPPETAGYPFDTIAQSDEPPRDIRRAFDLPRGADLPQPQVRVFDGLKAIIEASKVVEASWRVCIDDAGPPPEHEFVRPHTRQPVGKHIYENAIRQADRFLQAAGVGLELGTPEVDDKEENPF
jgi:hypothetical protein